MMLISIAIGLAAILNAVATTMLIRSDFETHFQKSAQMVFIWAVPFIGAILVIAILSQFNVHLKSRLNSNDSSAPWMPGMRPASIRESNHHGNWGENGHGGDGGNGGTAETVEMGVIEQTKIIPAARR
jgi:hypothetical protein